MTSVEAANELRAKEDMNLSGVDHVNRRKLMSHFDRGASLFKCFTCRAAGQRFAELHEPGWHRPVTVARFYRSSAEQDLALAFHDAADYQQWVPVMDDAAMLAHRALAIIVFRHSKGNATPTA